MQGMTSVICRLSDMDHVNSSSDLCSQTDEAYRLEHEDGPVSLSTISKVHQFKVLSIDGIIVKPSSKDLCIKNRNEVVLVENFLLVEE